MAEIDTSKWTKKAVVGLDEQGRISVTFRLHEGEIITPREINLYKRALTAQYFRALREARLNRRIAAAKVTAAPTT